MRARSGARKRWLLGGLLAAMIAGGVALGVVIAGGDEPSETAAESPLADPAAGEDPGTPEGPAGEGGPRERNGEGGRDPDPADEPPVIDEDELSDAEREAARTVRAYVDALSERDGAAVCELLAPGAIDAVELPEGRGGCAGSLRASIGYRDPRGLPVWDRARVRGLLTVALDGDRASVTATTVTRFADRDEPSIEDDVVHLVRDGDRWLIAKASSTLYRAVGIADVPPQVLAPPD